MSAPVPTLANALLELLRRRRSAPGSVVVDLASDDGGELIAVLRAAGYVPLCIAGDQVGADGVTSKGVGVVTGGLAEPDALFGDVLLALDDRHVAAVWLADLPARVPDMAELVRAAHWFGEQTGAALALCVPNVTHVDVGTKLLLGRWEPRESGVLSDAHVRHFSAGSLRSAMAELGWSEVDAEDLERAESDQHFPADAVPLERSTPVGAELAAVREMAGPGAYAEHLVRLYDAVMPEPPDAGDGVDAPFLSVLLRTQAKRWATLQETLLCLAAQTCSDFEVLVLVHDPDPGVTDEIAGLVGEFHRAFSGRVRVVEVRGGGRCRPLNDGAEAARGRYLATLDDDDLVFAHWVESLRDAALLAPGHAVRVGVATQQIAARSGTWSGGGTDDNDGEGGEDAEGGGGGARDEGEDGGGGARDEGEDGGGGARDEGEGGGGGARDEGEDGYDVVSRPRVDYPLDFDFVDHLRDNLTPNNGYATPRSLVTELGLGWDETLPVLEDWDHLLRSAEICGVASAPTVAAMVRVWVNAENSRTLHPVETWEETRRKIVDRHDSEPLLLDRGYFSKVRALAARAADFPELEQRLEHQLEVYAHELEVLRAEVTRLGAALSAEAEAHRASQEEAQKMAREVERVAREAQKATHEANKAADKAQQTARENQRLVAQAEEMAREAEEMAREAEEMRQTLARTGEALRVAGEATVALETARVDLQARLDDIYTSRSWRLTESVRKTTGAARRAAAAAKGLGRSRPERDEHREG